MNPGHILHFRVPVFTRKPNFAGIISFERALSFFSSTTAVLIFTVRIPEF